MDAIEDDDHLVEPHLQAAGLDKNFPPCPAFPDELDLSDRQAAGEDAVGARSVDPLARLGRRLAVDVVQQAQRPARALQRASQPQLLRHHAGDGAGAVISCTSEDIG